MDKNISLTRINVCNVNLKKIIIIGKRAIWGEDIDTTHNINKIEDPGA